MDHSGLERVCVYYQKYNHLEEWRGMTVPRAVVIYKIPSYDYVVYVYDLEHSIDESVYGYRVHVYVGEGGIIRGR